MISRSLLVKVGFKVMSRLGLKLMKYGAEATVPKNEFPPKLGVRNPDFLFTVGSGWEK